MKSFIACQSLSMSIESEGRKRSQTRPQLKWKPNRTRCQTLTQQYLNGLSLWKTKFSFMNDSDDEAKPDTADAAETKTNIIQVNNEIPEDLHPQKASEESEPAREDAKMEAERS